MIHTATVVIQSKESGTKICDLPFKLPPCSDCPNVSTCTLWAVCGIVQNWVKRKTNENEKPMKLFKVSHIADEAYEPIDIREERIFLDYSKAKMFYDNLNTKYYESVKYAVIKEYVILSMFNEGEKMSESEEVIISKEL